MATSLGCFPSLTVEFKGVVESLLVVRRGKGSSLSSPWPEAEEVARNISRARSGLT